MKRATAHDFNVIFRKLFKNFGPQHWWPGETQFEIIIGAILTQNTNWSNVEKAIANLKKANCLTPQGINNLTSKKLAELIKPSGYFNIKAKRVKNFINFLFYEYKGNLRHMSKEPTVKLRKKILSVNGIGPETADSILLYAFHKRVFVIDAYTKRFLYRHNMIDKNAEYHDIQKLFMEQTPKNTSQYNEYHALIVMLGKNYCKPKPRCEACPLKTFRYSMFHRCQKCYRDVSASERDNRTEICLECKEGSHRAR